jgi:hypothetical protein
MSSSAAVGSVTGGRLRRGEVISKSLLRIKTYVNGKNRMRSLHNNNPSEWLDALPSLDEEETEASGVEIRKDVRLGSTESERAGAEETA